MVYTHTKIGQWKAFSKLVKEYKDNYDIPYIDDLNIQENLKHYVKNINSQDKEIPLIISNLAYDLYVSITDNSITYEMFSEHVAIHVDSYVSQQYGDFPDENVANFTIEKIQGKLEGYIYRIGNSARGVEDEIRDSLKIAHFACYLYCLITTNNAQNMP